MKKLLVLGLLFNLGINLMYSQNYPLIQTPAIGEKKLTVLYGSFDGKVMPNSSIERVREAVNIFNRYTNNASGGKINVTLEAASSVYNFTETNTTVNQKQQLLRAKAQQDGININVPYIAYVFASEGNFGGTGTGDGRTGYVNIGGNSVWIPGVVHEMIHMFSVGHAHIREGGDAIFPGVVQGGSDPYFFMGSEGDFKNCPVGTTICEIFATMSLPHKGRFAWINEDEYTVSENDESEKFFKIFNHDNFTRTTTERLGIYLKGFYNEGVFVVSYLKVPNLDQRERLSTDGVMVHYVPYRSPAISELLDLTPNSITSNPERPNDQSFTNMHDAGDGAIGEGDSVDVSDLFNIEVIKENVETGVNNYSVEFKITPLTCAIVNSPFEKEDFVYSEIGNGDRCVESFSSLWNLNDASINIPEIESQSVEYQPLVSEGGSLNIPLDNGSVPRDPAFLMRRTLRKTYKDGDTMWLGYLLKVNQNRNGHIFVSPNDNVNIGIGKKWSNQLSINNTSVNSRPLSNGETVFLVAKYELNTGNNNDNIYMWANSGQNEPIKQNAVTFKENINIDEIREIGVNFKSIGDYNIDRITVADTYEALIGTTLSKPDIRAEFDLEFYPNPVETVLHLSNTELNPLDISIYSSLGKKVITLSNFTANKIDLGELSSGLYFLKVKDLRKQASKTYKLIKN